MERASATPMLDRKYMIDLWDVNVDVERDGISRGVRRVNAMGPRGFSEASMKHGTRLAHSILPNSRTDECCKDWEPYCHPLAGSSVMRLVFLPELVPPLNSELHHECHTTRQLLRISRRYFHHEVVRYITCSEWHVLTHSLPPS